MSATTFIVAFLLIATGIGAVTDLRTGRIPNEVSYALAVLAPLLYVVTGGPIAGAESLLVMVAMLAAALPVFAFNLLRGGDVKLIVACCALVSYHFVVPFLLYTMLCGGAVALVVAQRSGSLRTSLQAVRATAHPLLYGVMPTALPFTTRKMPYGVAIFAGAVLVSLAMTIAPQLRLVTW